MKRLCKRFFEILGIFSFSGFTYICIELLWRQRTTVEMFFVGAMAGVFIYLLNDIFTYNMDYLLQGVVCGLHITLLELIVGSIWNTDYHIWDYRHMWCNFNGQICILFTIIWIVLSLVFIPLMDCIECYVFDYMPNGDKPYYKVFGKTIFKIK